MNNTQLYLTIGVPSFVALISWITVILAWLSNKADIRDSETRLSSKIDKVESNIEHKIEKVDGRVDTLRGEMNGLRKEIYEALIPLHERMARLEAGK
jgi:peptidoglycan hydrolase CwlO-like protein